MEKRKNRGNGHNKQEIKLWLDTYNDIFSSFDSRPYSQRALSIDFLEEAERASNDKVHTGLKVKLHVPRRKRDAKNETMIKRRLKNHFGKHLRMLKNERKSILEKGVFFVVVGIALMLIATSILFNYGQKDMYTTFLIVLLEPGGWFFFWEGLNIIVFESKKINPRITFYRKMIRSRIEFLSY